MGCSGSGSGWGSGSGSGSGWTSSWAGMRGTSSGTSSGRTSSSSSWLKSTVMIYTVRPAVVPWSAEDWSVLVPDTAAARSAAGASSAGTGSSATSSRTAAAKGALPRRNACFQKFRTILKRTWVCSRSRALMNTMAGMVFLGSGSALLTISRVWRSTICTRYRSASWVWGQVSSSVPSVC